MGILGGKMGEESCDVDPNNLLLGVLTSVPIL